MDDLTTLRERLAEISDLGRAAGVLGWEQRVSMPPLGTSSRADALATLGRIIHDRFTDPEIGRLLDRLAPHEESHVLAITPGSTLHALYGDTLQVNSLHHQTIGDVGQGLVIAVVASLVAHGVTGTPGVRGLARRA